MKIVLQYHLSLGFHRFLLDVMPFYFCLPISCSLFPFSCRRGGGGTIPVASVLTLGRLLLLVVSVSFRPHVRRAPQCGGDHPLFATKAARRSIITAPRSAVMENDAEPLPDVQPPIASSAIPIMARIDTPSHSDEDFDLLYDVESVSELSEAQPEEEPEVEQSHRAPSSSLREDHGAGAERLAGPHEVPVMPFAATTGDEDEDDDDQSGVASVTQQFSGHSVKDQHTSSSALKRGSGTVKGRGNIVNGGLQYTKSMYNKLWSKDALIAVMG